MDEKKAFRTASPGELASLQGAKDASRGVRCRECGCADFYVRETERKKDGTIRRRRQCRNCGKRLTTQENAVK